MTPLDDYANSLLQSLSEMDGRIQDMFITTARTKAAFDSITRVMGGMGKPEFEAGDTVRARYKGRKGPLCEIVTVWRTGQTWQTEILILHSRARTTAPAEWFRTLTPLELLAVQAE